MLYGAVVVILCHNLHTVPLGPSVPPEDLFVLLLKPYGSQMCKAAAAGITPVSIAGGDGHC
jgi:hypothetical protein